MLIVIEPKIVGEVIYQKSDSMFLLHRKDYKFHMLIMPCYGVQTLGIWITMGPLLHPSNDFEIGFK